MAGEATGGAPAFELPTLPACRTAADYETAVDGGGGSDGTSDDRRLFSSPRGDHRGSGRADCRDGWAVGGYNDGFDNVIPPAAADWLTAFDIPRSIVRTCPPPKTARHHPAMEARGRPPRGAGRLRPRPRPPLPPPSTHLRGCSTRGSTLNLEGDRREGEEFLKIQWVGFNRRQRQKEGTRGRGVGAPLAAAEDGTTIHGKRIDPAWHALDSGRSGRGLRGRSRGVRQCLPDVSI